MISNAQGYRVKALIVEEIATCSFLLDTFLRMFHCETIVAKNGKEAMNRFLEGGKFDIVFVDKHLPVMYGPEVVEIIHAMGETDVKIAGVSADHNSMEEFMNAGADEFVPKPMKRETVRTMIQEVINKKNAMV